MVCDCVWLAAADGWLSGTNTRPAGLGPAESVSEPESTSMLSGREAVDCVHVTGSAASSAVGLWVWRPSKAAGEAVVDVRDDIRWAWGWQQQMI